MLLTCETTNWAAHELSLDIGKKIASSNKRLVISETWVDIKSQGIPMAKTWLESDPQHTVIFVSTFDPSIIEMNKSFVTEMFNTNEQFRISYINCKDICFWLLAVGRYFLNYSIADVTVRNFKYNFLCYQRKFYSSRTYLYEKLQNKTTGIITIGNMKFNDINSNIPDHRGLTEVRGELMISNDIWSLGNIEIWNSSFLNIVSETWQPLDAAYPFVSEKIFKPIIGLRPFICFGHPKTSELLKSLGFETFDEEFGYRPVESWDTNADQIANIVDNLDTAMFDDLMPKLIHNKNHFKSAVEAEWRKLTSLIRTFNQQGK